MVTFVDPISLGVIAPPSHYGADIVCGDIQSLGIHMNYGGGCGGFIATRDEEKFVMEYPSRLFGITGTVIGAIILTLVVNGLNLMGVPTVWHQLVIGAVILAAVFIDLQVKKLMD